MTPNAGLSLPGNHRCKNHLLGRIRYISSVINKAAIAGIMFYNSHISFDTAAEDNDLEVAQII